jgi:4-amino-4-deoxychorismate lyase
MKVYESSYDYDYSFPAVTLAYFLRYPNPYAKHVLSTDVIDRYVDPVTHRLHTTRLHLKRSKVPGGILRFLPKGLAGPGGASQSYVLEKSTVDVKEGWMESESRNMEWTGILNVIERQVYTRQPMPPEMSTEKSAGTESQAQNPPKRRKRTSCKTTVTFISRLGQAKALARKQKAEEAAAQEEEEAPRQGFFASWSTRGVQRTVELVGVRRTQSALTNGRIGMNVVLERLRSGGIVGVLEGMRKDRAEAFGPNGPWKQVWMNGTPGFDEQRPSFKPENE